MSQSVKDLKDARVRRTRPGQRQQERLMRLERRKKRQRLIISIVVFVLLCVVVGVGAWQYQIYQTKQTDLGHQHATATAKALITPTPSAGPATPPPVKGQAQTQSDGLQYIDVKVGTGATIQSGDAVNVEYTGWLQSNGKKFDSSYDHGGQVLSLTAGTGQLAGGQGQVIKGFGEGLVGMKVGGTRRLIIPSSIGYGDQGSPPTIPGKATLIFDITIVSKS